MIAQVSLAFLLVLSVAEAQPSARPMPPISYNFQVKPILANNCFRCHGPDEKARKGKLRLDLEEETKGAWKVGEKEDAEAIKRLFTTDPDEVMPPPEAHSEMTSADRELLRSWVAQGAKYERHWAFVPPVSPPVPGFQSPAPPAPKPAPKVKGTVKDQPKTSVEMSLPAGRLVPAHFPLRQPIDAFVLDRLLQEKVSPAAEASPEQFLRRVTLDLTGVPPTLAEIQACLADQSPQRWEKIVDRLLASPAFGERMATDWLDAARYADSYGRHEDADSPVWPYRDWVIRAYNQNLPFDQFLLWQTAGDLLPKPTQDQLIATTFNRLANQSNEAGSNEEEFRQDIIADRIKTNATAILGLTMECARCHDHKYDPITTKDYYSMAAYLNNINELGLYSESTAGIPAPTMYVFDEREDKQHAELVAAIEQAERQVLKVVETATGRWSAWKASHGVPPVAPPSDYFQFEPIDKKDRVEGLSSKRMAINDARRKDTPNLFKGLYESIPGVKGQAMVMDGSNALAVVGRGQFHRSDPFSFSLWVRPTENQDRAILLHRSVAGLEAASRGYEIVIDHMHLDFALSHVAPGNSIRIRTKSTLPLNTWTHLVATYDGSSRVEGLKLYLNGALASVEIISDHLYKDITYRKEWGDFDPAKVQNNIHTTVEMTLGNRYHDMGARNIGMDEFKVFPLTLTAAEVVELQTGKLPPDEGDAFRRYLRDLDPEYQQAMMTLHAARTAEDDFVSQSKELMVMRENAVPRKTFILNRGQWDQPGEQVTAGTPASIWEVPAEFPQNRLGLGLWFTDVRNPLVARVAVNRLWQMFFGKGLVSTPEDFGIQGRLPTHPALLDWLACDFRDLGWDVKRVCRTIALSSTYRQSSMASDPKTMKNDPDNALLAHGPRHRLSAEMLRDLALQAAEMITPHIGGEPVHAYLPDNLYPDSGIQETYQQDHGDKLWQRSIYLYRKRTLPLPFLTTFDASTREYCRVRRETTATPLQALALMNAPDFLEPCRVLAQKILASNTTLAQALPQSFQRFTGRLPSAAELKVLLAMHDEQLAFYETHLELAQELVAKSGETPADPKLKPAAVAALTLVHRAILNNSDTMMKK